MSGGIFVRINKNRSMKYNQKDRNISNSKYYPNQQLRSRFRLRLKSGGRRVVIKL